MAVVVNKFLIFDITNKEASEFSFSSKANIIYSDDNTSGKSCLLKSLYYALGLQIKNFASGWNYKDMAFKVYYTHDGKQGTILRHKDNFWIDNIDQVLSERDYSEWLSDLLSIRIKLPTKQDTMPQKVVASAILNLFYIDQDSSWDKSPYKNTINLAWYDAKSIPKVVFEHVLGIKSSLNIDLAEKISSLGKRKAIADNQLNVLVELRNEFVTKDTSVEFDEEKLKNEIKKYLDYASEIQTIIGKYKSKVYSEKIKLDAFEGELRDYNEILFYNEKTYKDYSHECPKCHSVLTDEQSLERIKISNNILNLKIAISDLEKNIARSRNNITKLLAQKLDVEKEHKKLLAVANAKEGELTLEQHLMNKSKQMTKAKYYEIKSTLTEQADNLDAQIRKLNTESRKLLASQAKKEKIISADFKNIMFKYSLRFNTVNFDSNFLEFKQINESGAVKNQKFLAFYMAYSKILIDYSSIELPFVLDSIVKDELDAEILSKSYELVEEVLLNSEKQSFFAILVDKLNLIGQQHHMIKIEKQNRILSKENFEMLEHELLLI